MTSKDLVTLFKNKIFSEVVLFYHMKGICMSSIPFPIGVSVVPSNDRNEIVSIKVLGTMEEAHMMEIPTNGFLVKINESPETIPE